MQVVVGTELDESPRFWRAGDTWYLPQVKAMMVSYFDFHRRPRKRRAAMDQGIHGYLGVSEGTKVYLDNGAFAFWRRGMDPPVSEYSEFVRSALPDWFPVPADFIPSPNLERASQHELMRRTMAMNVDFADKGFVPVLHAGDWLEEYLEAFEREGFLRGPHIAIGGLVPRLLSSRGATTRRNVVDSLRRVRAAYPYSLHAFGIGGLNTLHVAAVLGVNSLDSSGWRNRAARGLILLPGRGERSVIPLGSWHGVEVSEQEMVLLAKCECPACTAHGIEGLRQRNDRANHEGRGNGSSGFNRRAVHNLWTLLREAQSIDGHMQIGDYAEWYSTHVVGTMQKLVAYTLEDAGRL
jgi:queuine/archaeosine tRNA-ribosyltransferase